MILIGQFKYKDEADLLESFRELLKPKSSQKFSEYSVDDIAEFSDIMDWLYSNNYIIREFPNVIKRKMTLKSFGTDLIRDHILTQNPKLDKVTWSKRRTLINSLTIERKYDDSFEIIPEINMIMNDIAMGTGNFQVNSKESKLSMLNNCIENILKEGRNFKKIDSDIFFDFLNEDDVINFKNDTQIFRHHSTDSINERKHWSEDKKDFYIRLGIIMVTEIFKQKKAY